MAVSHSPNIPVQRALAFKRLCIHAFASFSVDAFITRVRLGMATKKEKPISPEKENNEMLKRNSSAVIFFIVLFVTMNLRENLNMMAAG